MSLRENEHPINKNVNDECWKIEHEFPVPTDLGEGIMFSEFIQKCSHIYENDIKTQVNIGKKCKDCQFYNKK